MSKKHITPPFAARTIHRFSVLIILAWLAITVIMTIGVPPLQQVATERSVSLDPTDAPSFKALKRMGEVFNESNSNSVAMIVLEGQQRLGDDVHQYYDSLILQLKDDPHVKHIHDFWGDPLTAAAAESADGKAVFVQVDLTGSLGETSANESAEAVDGIVDRTPPPPGQSHYSQHGSDPHHVAALLPFNYHRNSFIGDCRHRIASSARNRGVSRP